MSDKLITIVGHNGAGKDEAGIILAQQLHSTYGLGDIPVKSISSPLRDHFTSQGITPTRELMVDYNLSITRKLGPAALAAILLDQSRDSPLTIVTGPRQVMQLDLFKNKTMAYCSLAVITDPKIRYSRLRASGKINEEATSFEEFMSAELTENSPPNPQRTDECIAKADFIINNNGSLDELRHQITTLTPYIFKKN